MCEDVSNPLPQLKMEEPYTLMNCCSDCSYIFSNSQTMLLMSISDRDTMTRINVWSSVPAPYGG